jgi:hypothetical protein
MMQVHFDTLPCPSDPSKCEYLVNGKEKSNLCRANENRFCKKTVRGMTEEFAGLPLPCPEYHLDCEYFDMDFNTCHANGNKKCKELK